MTQRFSKTAIIGNLFAALVVFLLAVPLSVSDEKKPISEAVKDLPVFDAQMHYDEPATRYQASASFKRQ